MTTKADILKQMAEVAEINCVETAHEYLNKLVDAGMEFQNAESRVLSHFTGIDQEDLETLYDTQ